MTTTLLRATTLQRGNLPRLPAGNYFYTSSSNTAGTSATLGVGSMRVAPWVVWAPTPITRLGVDISAAGEAGAKFRPVLYADNGFTYPGDLLVDAGQLAADAVAVVFADVSAFLLPGLYWVGGAVQAVTTTSPTIRTVSAPTAPITPPAGAGAPSAAGTTYGHIASSVTGAPPTTFPAGSSGSGSAARIIART